MAILVCLIVIVGLYIFISKFWNWLQKGNEESEEKEKKLLNELFEKHNENYEKWEKGYCDFFETVKQCYNWDSEEGKKCLYHIRVNYIMFLV